MDDRVTVFEGKHDEFLELSTQLSRTVKRTEAGTAILTMS
jgi:hypothetical protein